MVPLVLGGRGRALFTMCDGRPPSHARMALRRVAADEILSPRGHVPLLLSADRCSSRVVGEPQFSRNCLRPGRRCLANLRHRLHGSNSGCMRCVCPGLRKCAFSRGHLEPDSGDGPLGRHLVGHDGRRQSGMARRHRRQDAGPAIMSGLAGNRRCNRHGNYQQAHHVRRTRSDMECCRREVHRLARPRRKRPQSHPSLAFEPTEFELADEDPGALRLQSPLE